MLSLKRHCYIYPKLEQKWCQSAKYQSYTCNERIV